MGTTIKELQKQLDVELHRLPALQDTLSKLQAKEQIARIDRDRCLSKIRILRNQIKPGWGDEAAGDDEE